MQANAARKVTYNMCMFVLVFVFRSAFSVDFVMDYENDFPHFLLLSYFHSYKKNPK